MYPLIFKLICTPLCKRPSLVSQQFDFGHSSATPSECERCCKYLSTLLPVLPFFEIAHRALGIRFGSQPCMAYIASFAGRPFPAGHHGGPPGVWNKRSFTGQVTSLTHEYGCVPTPTASPNLAFLRWPSPTCSERSLKLNWNISF